ncbi:hypothetical protein [Chryseolinea lacunae]|uniref:Pentapeptide repeat-containing protein n=1 Tax=Chryseolinea lacunae TaxID=2801331 RepID=A0ABS1KJZ0_9BACT|nr:hypothetical protein [Chryseolinea lacunae]MBL0739780.1 hypothetical protein [Chryseolinea lacunae]
MYRLLCLILMLISSSSFAQKANSDSVYINHEFNGREFNYSKHANLYFEKILENRHWKIHTNFNLYECAVRSPVQYINKSFYSNFRFEYVDFYGYVQFFNDSIKSRPYLARSVFHQGLDFGETVFEEGLALEEDTIYGNFTLERSKSYGPININLSEFNGGITIDDATFEQDILFQSCNIKNRISMINLQLLGESSLIFFENHLPEYLFFQGVKIEQGEIDLSRLAFKPGEVHRIALYRADITKFHLDYIHFKLLLVDQHNKELSIEEINTIYESLLRNFNDRGQIQSFELLDIEFNDYKWAHGKFPWVWWIPHYWNFYGHRKGMVFLWAFVFLFMFSFLSYFMYDGLNDRNHGVYVIESIPTAKKINNYERMWYSFIYTSCIFFMFSLKIDKIRFRKKAMTFYLVVVSITGLICIAYMGAYVLDK